MTRTLATYATRLALNRRFRDALLLLVVKRIGDEYAAYRAQAILRDFGYDDCPVCLANRRLP